jgi:hypothetical protein
MADGRKPAAHFDSIREEHAILGLAGGVSNADEIGTSAQHFQRNFPRKLAFKESAWDPIFPATKFHCVAAIGAVS